MDEDGYEDDSDVGGFEFTDQMKADHKEKSRNFLESLKNKKAKPKSAPIPTTCPTFPR